jgi:hypothetical protein
MQFNNQYLIGNSSVLNANITSNSILANPSTLTLTVEMPDGTITTYTYGVVYKATVNLTQSGYWKYRWDSIAPNGAVESTFCVTPSIIP